MVRKHFYLSQEALDALEKLAETAHLNTSQFLNKALLDMAAELAGADTCKSAANEAHRAYLTAHETDKKVAILLDSWNSYLHRFEDAAMADDFQEATKFPHPWLKKAEEAEEQRRRIAYQQKTKRPNDT